MRFSIRRLETTASTNDDAKNAGEQGAPEGTVIWALEQKSGRGRQGRQWHSPPGNLYFSLLLRPQNTDYGLISFVAALAIRDAVHAFLPHAQIELKWPNDVLVGGKKISGILLEAGQGWLVAGMGINVALMPENPLYPVTSLNAEKTEPELETLLNAVLQAFDGWYEKLQIHGFAPIRQSWLACARQGSMRARLPNEEISGIFAGLDETGRLCLLLADGTTRKLAAGDVFF